MQQTTDMHISIFQASTKSWISIYIHACFLKTLGPLSIFLHSSMDCTQDIFLELTDMHVGSMDMGMGIIRTL